MTGTEACELKVWDDSEL